MQCDKKKEKEKHDVELNRNLWKICMHWLNTQIVIYMHINQNSHTLKKRKEEKENTEKAHTHKEKMNATQNDWIKMVKSMLYIVRNIE